MLSYVLVIVVVVAVAIGQLLFKFVALRFPEDVDFGGFFDDSVAMVAMACALTLYVVGTGLWVHVLRSLPLSVAYPFLALSFVIVPIAAAIFLNEHLTMYNFWGTAFIVAGIYFCLQTD